MVRCTENEVSLQISAPASGVRPRPWHSYLVGGLVKVRAGDVTFPGHRLDVITDQSNAALAGRLASVQETVAIKPRLQLRFDYDPTMTYRARLLPFDASKK